MGKAERAVLSAQRLLSDGDVDGATDRAYYAMFNAARAALRQIGGVSAQEMPIKHKGVLIFLRDRLVERGVVPAELIKSINRAIEVRNIADYKDEEVGLDDARKTVEEAEKFVSTIRAICWSANDGGGDGSGGGVAGGPPPRKPGGGLSL